MGTLATFLAGVLGLALTVGLVVGVGTVAVRALVGNPLRTDDNVMPSHYASLVSATPSKFPGYCPECGTNNGREASVCKHCSSRLPASRSELRNDDTNTVFTD